MRVTFFLQSKNLKHNAVLRAVKENILEQLSCGKSLSKFADLLQDLCEMEVNRVTYV